MTRPAHALKRNHGNSLPRTLFYFDTETTTRPGPAPGQERHELRLGWACHVERREPRRRDSETWLEFRTVEELWGWILERTRPRERAVIVAHNLVFDLLVTAGFPYLSAQGFDVSALYDRNKTFIAKMQRPDPTDAGSYCPECGAISNGKFETDADGKKWYLCECGGRWKRGRQQTLLLVDNYNIAPYPLAEIGEVLGLEKLPKPDFENCEDAELSTYCRRDVEILVQWWRYWLGEILEQDLGCWSMTLAGQAFNAYRHRFMSTPIFMHDAAKITQQERSSYYGGRNECYYIGERPGRVWNLDVNSMYPHVMAANVYPHKFLYCRSIIEPDELAALLEQGYCASAKVELETEEPAYPYRRAGSGLLFPVGKFTTYLNTPELAHALERGHIRRIRFVAIYAAAPIFAEYVAWVYARRLAMKASGDKVRDTIYKLLANSLYGKFGQKSPTWETYTVDDAAELAEEHYSPETGQVYAVRQIGRTVQVQTGFKEAYNSFPAISAHVTAHARMYLWELINRAGRRNVLYCDTDSLFVTPTGYQRLRADIHPERLGALSVRGYSENGVDIRAPKDYTFAGAITRKGVRDDAEEIAPGTFRQTHWPGLSTHLRAGVLDGFITQQVEKTLNPQYDKGTRGNSGRVSPILLEEW